MKKIAQITTLIPLSIYLLYCSYHVITKPSNPTYLDCGKIISKSTDEVAIKHGTKTELYLNIQFNKSGFRSINCDPTTYFSKKNGDNICFNLSKKMNDWYNINNFVGMSFLMILGIICVFFFVIYILPNKWKI